MATIILGGGIMGVATAFYLSQEPSSTKAEDIHIIEAAPELFASASGYAGGFLAADWFADSTAPLGRLSFDLHKQLAEQHGGAQEWGYCKCTGTSWTTGPRDGKRGDDWLRQGTSRSDAAASKGPMKGTRPVWLSDKKDGHFEVISENDTTAQVDPMRLCRFMLKTCLERGVQLHQPARATSVRRDAAGILDSIVIEGTGKSSEKTRLSCKRLVLTAGAWSPRVFKQLFPKTPIQLPVTSLAGHSLVVRSPRWRSGDESIAAGGGCHSVFTTDGTGYCPEIFSRVGGEIYVAGLNDASVPLPDIVTDRKLDPKCMQTLRQTARRLLGEASTASGDDSDSMGDLEIIREGLCWRPVTSWGAPIVGPILDQDLGPDYRTADGGGVWMAAGHGPWGISHSLGTGKVLSELVEGRQPSCDVSALELGMRSRSML